VPVAIDNVIIKKTTNCPSGFYCLINRENHRCFPELSMCTVRSFAEDYLIVVYRDDLDCPYQAGNETDCICNCPTRHEIYSQTGF
jgi:hypothetical protein